MNRLACLAATVVAVAIPLAMTRAQDVLRTKSGVELHGVLEDRGISYATFADVELGQVHVPWTSIEAVRPGGAPETLFDPAFVGSDDDERPETYVRWEVGKGNEPDRLLTGTSRWLHRPTGAIVLLVGVVHIADGISYERLQARLDSCDRVLFESVGRGDATEEELAKLDVLFRMQLLMRDALGLTFQKDGLCYDRPFWVRADVDADELRRSLEARGAGLPTDAPFVQALLKRLTAAADSGRGQRSPTLRARAARLLGPALAEADRIMQQPGLAGLRGAIVEDRNTAALAVLEDELRRDATTPGTTIAMLYGAAHLADFDARFAANPEFVWQGTEWETAWTVPAEETLPRVDRRAIDELIDEVTAKFDGRLEIAVWLGGPLGPSWFERGADRVMAAASSIKTAYLVELFAEHAGRLDEPLPGLEAIITDDAHPAVVHFTPEVRAEIVREMRGVSCRRVAQMMIHGIGVSNEVYNAAANVTTAVLDGPDGLTDRIRDRFGPGAAVRRYMLAARDVTGDNQVSARFLATPLQALARGRLRGVTRDTVQAMRDILFLEEDPVRGRHWSKTGELDSDPMTRIRSGFWQTPDGRVLVYVVMGQLEHPGDEARDVVAERLGETVAALTDGVVRAALP